MKTSAIQRKTAARANNPARGPLPTRDRVLEAACELFAASGFHGTHLREISKRAGTNVAGVCYYFHRKEGLYEAVIMEAGRRLRDRTVDFVALQHLPPDQSLQKLVESLSQRLRNEGAWIAKLLARELVDAPYGAHIYAASMLERDFVLLQAVMRKLLGPGAHSEALRLQALSVIGACVYYSLAGQNSHHPLTQLAVSLPGPAALARSVTERSLAALERERTEPGGSPSVPSLLSCTRTQAPAPVTRPGLSSNR